MRVLGIDIGGSGVKAAVVDTATGEMQTERYRVETPRPAKRAALVAALVDVAEHFEWQGPVGCGFPGVVCGQRTATAANLHDSLVDVALGEDLTSLFGEPAWLINDADAAGLAEMRFGLGQGQRGVTLFLTVGTGIGTALFVDGQLVPNLELGHMLMHCGKDRFDEAEQFAADAARKREDLKWPEWAARFNRFLAVIHALLWPDRIIVGGGVAKKGDRFLEYIESPCPLELARLQNRAGMIGAAVAAADRVGEGLDYLR